MNAHANLLPLAFRRRLLWRSRLRRWAPIWALAAVAAACAGYWQHRLLDGRRAALARLEAQAAPLAALVDDNRRLRAQLDELAGRQSLLRLLEPRLRPVQLIGVVSHSARRGTPRVQVRRFELRPSQVAESAPGAGGANPPPRPQRPPVQLNLAGIARDDLAIAEFVTALRDFGVFRSVELRSSADAAAEGPPRPGMAPGTRAYTVECVFSGDEP
ncbi:MAG TPA: hypothetical protein VML55_02365 [Planctomycetaceae bacterium]|nr:hypothetical protein [Planctomycetaceae bacterium]